MRSVRVALVSLVGGAVALVALGVAIGEQQPPAPAPHAEAGTAAAAPPASPAPPATPATSAPPASGSGPAQPAGAASGPGAAAPARKVQIHILVIEADKKAEHFDKRVERYRNAMPGYKGATLLDELSATAEQGGSVSLGILRQSGKSRLLKVTVDAITPDQKIKLRVSVDGLKFNAQTTHKNGATLLVRHPMPGDKALFLAVTPRM